MKLKFGHWFEIFSWLLRSHVTFCSSSSRVCHPGMVQYMMVYLFSPSQQEVLHQDDEYCCIPSACSVGPFTVHTCSVMYSVMYS